jgi:hypothetical protein
MTKFDTLPAMGGYEVICTDTGRPVGHRLYEDMRAANGAAQRLNRAAAHGTKALARALGSTDSPLPHEYAGGRNFG